MSYSEALEIILRDKKSHNVPILYIIQILIILEEAGALEDE